MTNEQIRANIENLRFHAATCLASKDYEVRDRARGMLRMVESLKVILLARGQNVVVTSKTGHKWTVKQ